MTRGVLALVAIMITIASGTASATPIALPSTKAVLDVPAAWTKLAADPSLVVAYQSPTGIVLAVTRGAVPNASAWIAGSKAAYAAEIERGAVAAVPGQRKLTSQLGEINGVPAYDLELRRTDGSTIVLRILLFRTYALAATALVPKGGSLDDARAITSKFGPPRT